ncbi:MAG: right-handed parallel beta-helix repeat-containing protein [Anaerolineae bacterium]|nr:right-handed parallel beta-helix repeat-containing protein [Anaerolineae bacterium]
MHRTIIWIGIAALLGAIITLMGITAPTAAQAPLPDSIPPGEPDTESLLDLHFQLQNYYNHVLCVSGDGSCPADVTVTVPNLTAPAHYQIIYPIQDTFTTIQAAADTAQPGDLILIMPGRYAGVEIEGTGGEDSAYIHFLGWGDPGSVIVDAPADPEKSYLRHHFYFIDAHHYIIQNIAFEGAEGAGVFVSGYFSATGHFAHHFIFMDLYSHDNGTWGLHTTSTSSVVIQDSTFTGSREEHGVYISGSGDHIFIRRNVFQGNAAAGLQVNADPQTATEELFWWLHNATGDTCGISEDDVWLTEWQTVKDCYDAQGLPDLGLFIEDGISTGLRIEQNVITGNGAAGGAGINLASVTWSEVRNNLIYGNDAAGIACWDNAYAAEKELASSRFGCYSLNIYHNTIVDESGNRGALILNQDARNMWVYHNIIVRDRFDAYEITGRSGAGLTSFGNAYSAQWIEDSPDIAQIDTDPDAGSITGFSVSEALDQFVAPGFAPWVLLDGAWPGLNPDRPDYHLRPASAWATLAQNQALQYDLLGDPRGGAAIGALNPAAGSKGDTALARFISNIPHPLTPSPSMARENQVMSLRQDSPFLHLGWGKGVGGIGANQDLVEKIPRQTAITPPTITYRLAGDDYNGHIYRVVAEPGAEPESLTLALDALAPRSGDPAINTVDEWVNISPDGQWLLISTERFDPECEGWACLVLLPSDVSRYEVIRAGGAVIHAEGFSAVGRGGRIIVYPASGGPHAVDLWAIARAEDGTWSDPILLTGDSPYNWHGHPAINDYGPSSTFDCGDAAYGQEVTAICSVMHDGSYFSVDLTPENGELGTALHHPSRASLATSAFVFEADWGNTERIWIALWDMDQAQFISTLGKEDFTNDNSPCLLPDDRIASLWLNRPGNDPGYHELKVMEPDGSDYFMLVTDSDVLDTGLGCGGGLAGE